tara:strand:- start:87 stop:356 length:270 start_codon:yes stop_codon:yes gene_type:complete
MNLGVERFLILGCLAVVVLEIPNLIGDVESASVQNEVVEQMIAERAADAAALEAIEVANVAPAVDADPTMAEVLAALRTDELLPARPGL